MSGGNADLMRSNESTSAVCNADGSEAAVASMITGSRSDRETSTCVRDRVLNADRRATGRSAAGPVHGQRCLRSRNLTDRFRFRRRELASSIMATRSNVRPSPPVRRAGADDTPHSPYVKANLHGSLVTLIPERSTDSGEKKAKN